MLWARRPLVVQLRFDFCGSAYERRAADLCSVKPGKEMGRSR